MVMGRPVYTAAVITNALDVPIHMDDMPANRVIVALLHTVSHSFLLAISNRIIAVSTRSFLLLFTCCALM